MNLQMPEEMRANIARLLAFIAADGCSDDEFEALARDLFALQYAHNAPLRRFCQARGRTPGRMASWREIPPVPISAFKDATLSCVAAESCERIFMTSGTSRGELKGRNHHPTIAVWDSSMRTHFASRFMRGGPRIDMVILFPNEETLPNSSLARYLTLATRIFGTPRSRFCVGDAGLDVQAVCEAAERAQNSGEPLALLGASFSFVHLFDALQAAGRTFRLPAGSRVLDTGGYKNQSREMAPDAFYDTLAATFGIERSDCINMYGMTELSSQFYDNGNAVLPSVKSGPHWMRTRVVDPLTGRDVPAGERGVLAHCDLANFNSSIAILTEDVGVADGSGFLLLGRAEGAEAKGCSLALQDFLQAAA